MTTTSAGDGPSAGDAGSSGDGDRGWFAPRGAGPAGPPVPPAAPQPYAPEPYAPASPREAELVRRSLEELRPHSDDATAYFYALLFVQNPELREAFPISMDTQRDRLLRALLTTAQLAERPAELRRYLAGLGRGHRKYGTRPEHYPAVGECLLAAIEQYAPNSWSEETELAWARIYTTMSQIMIDAAAEDELLTPAWWQAEIVSHELRTRSIAVITVRPDQPYPYLAGQYAAVETPWWPRVWRHYSFATSPRSDGLLTFHVKAVPAGWVSTALVHRAQPGDVIRLGPAAGGMTVDHTSASGLVCLAGGTGIAPIKALVQDVVEHGRARPVEVFYGAPSEGDLYDLDTLLELQREFGWLSVRPVVARGGEPLLGATGPGATGPGASGAVQPLTGRLVDAVRQYGPWPAHLGYLSGPPGMIRSGMAALAGAGITSDRIRHDSLEELVGNGAGQ